MTTYVNLWYLAQFFLGWEMFQTNLVEKIKTLILGSITFFRKSCRLWDNVKKYGTAWQATDDSTIQGMRIARLMTKSTYINWELCNTRCFSTATVIARTRLNVTFTLHYLSCNIIFCPSRFSKWTFQVFRLNFLYEFIFSPLFVACHFCRALLRLIIPVFSRKYVSWSAFYVIFFKA
jgi:hypothetical protein